MSVQPLKQKAWKPNLDLQSFVVNPKSTTKARRLFSRGNNVAQSKHREEIEKLTINLIEKIKTSGLDLIQQDSHHTLANHEMNPNLQNSKRYDMSNRSSLHDQDFFKNSRPGLEDEKRSIVVLDFEETPEPVMEPVLEAKVIESEEKAKEDEVLPEKNLDYPQIKNYK